MSVQDDEVLQLEKLLIEVITSAGTREVYTTIPEEALPLTPETKLSGIEFVGFEIDAINRKLQEALRLPDYSLELVGRLLRRLPCNDRQEHRAIPGYCIHDLAEDLWPRIIFLRQVAFAERLPYSTTADLPQA